MADLFTLDNAFTLLMLIFLQAVLGFDNLLYISLESKRVPKTSSRWCAAGASAWAFKEISHMLSRGARHGHRHHLLGPAD